MKTYADCEYCGSAGSVEFDMCQVCLKDHTESDDIRPERPRVTALSLEVDRIITASASMRPPVFAGGRHG
jgi:hypothetical protein